MTQYDRLGITIEACPSSNVHISRIVDCMEHPCLRWHPPLPALLVLQLSFSFPSWSAVAISHREGLIVAI